MTVDASRSCLGLETCVGSATRQIVVDRVLLTATPALPSSSVSGGSLAPPLDAITGFFRSARCRRHAPGDGPDEAGQFTGDCGSEHQARHPRDSSPMHEARHRPIRRNPRYLHTVRRVAPSASSGPGPAKGRRAVVDPAPIEARSDKCRSSRLPDH